MCGAYVIISSAAKRLAVKLSKICNDLRLLSSGPRAGLKEINLPEMQAGSSIMPGKVNPVIPEVVNQVCFKVIGNDVTITLAAAGPSVSFDSATLDVRTIPEPGTWALLLCGLAGGGLLLRQRR